MTKTLRDSSGALLIYRFREDGTVSRDYMPVSRHTTGWIKSDYRYPKHHDAEIEIEDKIVAGWREIA